MRRCEQCQPPPTLTTNRDVEALVSSSNSPEDLKHLRTISDCTRGIAFLGTPHAGSALATWAQLLRRSITAFKQTNKDILAVLGQDSKMLQEVRNSFDAMIQARARDEKRAIAITCFYEELPVIGLGREVRKCFTFHPETGSY